MAETQVIPSLPPGGGPVPDAPRPMPPVPCGNAGPTPPGPGVGAPSLLPPGPGRVGDTEAQPGPATTARKSPPDVAGHSSSNLPVAKGPARPRLISTLKKSRPDGEDANDDAYDEDEDGYGVRGCPTGVHPTNSEFTPHKYPCAGPGSGGGGDAVLPVPRTGQAGTRPPVSDDEARNERPNGVDGPAVPPLGDAATRLTQSPEGEEKTGSPARSPGGIADEVIAELVLGASDLNDAPGGDNGTAGDGPARREGTDDVDAAVDYLMNADAGSAKVTGPVKVPIKVPIKVPAKVPGRHPTAAPRATRKLVAVAGYGRPAPASAASGPPPPAAAKKLVAVAGYGRPPPPSRAPAQAAAGRKPAPARSGGAARSPARRRKEAPPQAAAQQAQAGGRRRRTAQSHPPPGSPARVRPAPGYWAGPPATPVAAPPAGSYKADGPVPTAVPFLPVPPPSDAVRDWTSSMPVTRARSSVAVGLRVKVRSAPPLEGSAAAFALSSPGGTLGYTLWRGGSITTVSGTGVSVEIEFDDGAVRTTVFPNANVVVDDAGNGRHYAERWSSVDAFLPGPDGGVGGGGGGCGGGRPGVSFRGGEDEVNTYERTPIPSDEDGPAGPASAGASRLAAVSPARKRAAELMASMACGVGGAAGSLMSPAGAKAAAGLASLGGARLGRSSRPGAGGGLDVPRSIEEEPSGGGAKLPSRRGRVAAGAAPRVPGRRGPGRPSKVEVAAREAAEREARRAAGMAELRRAAADSIVHGADDDSDDDVRVGGNSADVPLFEARLEVRGKRRRAPSAKKRTSAAGEEGDEEYVPSPKRRRAVKPSGGGGRKRSRGGKAPSSSSSSSSSAARGAAPVPADVSVADASVALSGAALERARQNFTGHSKLTGGFSFSLDGSRRKGPLPTGDAASKARFDEAERRMTGFVWIERGKFGKYRSRISLVGRKVELGCYDLACDAARAYDLAAVKFKRDDAETNFGGEEEYVRARELEERAYGVTVDMDAARAAIEAKVRAAK